MRERIAIAISVLAVAVLVLLSVGFAIHQNPAPAASAGALEPSPPAPQAPSHERGVEAPGPEPREMPQANDSVAGHAVFRAQGCERCHSVQGEGSPRYPLDGVGSRRTLDELRAWTIGGTAVQDSLSPSALRAKQRYEQIPEEAMRALLAWLRSLLDG